MVGAFVVSPPFLPLRRRSLASGDSVQTPFAISWSGTCSSGGNKTRTLHVHVERRRDGERQRAIARPARPAYRCTSSIFAPAGPSRYAKFTIVPLASFSGRGSVVNFTLCALSSVVFASRFGVRQPM